MASDGDDDSRHGDPEHGASHKHSTEHSNLVYRGQIDSSSDLHEPLTDSDDF
jgi:hypothetical protein